MLLLLFGILGGLGLMTWFNDNPRFKSLFGNIGLDSISSAKYAVIGGAARFLDAFDRNHGHDDVQTIDKHFTHEFDPTGDLEFIEAELHVSDIHELRTNVTCMHSLAYIFDMLCTHRLTIFYMLRMHYYMLRTRPIFLMLSI